MSLVAAAVCPHPPLMVPQVGAGAAGETDDLRAACDAAVHQLIKAGPDVLVVVGGGTRTEVLAPPYVGDFSRWGACTTYRLGGDAAQRNADSPTGHVAAALVGPLSVLVGGWLVSRRVHSPTDVTLATVSADAAPLDCAAIGEQFADRAPRVALLVMGDGSTCAGPNEAGCDDPRAAAYDSAVARALADARPQALLDLDPVLSARLNVAGRASWQVLAGAVLSTGVQWRGELTHAGAPYGVAYFVASWQPA